MSSGKKQSKIFYHPLVRKDISKLPKNILERIQKRIEDELSYYPDILGERLRGPFKDLWKFRSGDYRIVYRLIKGSIYIIKIAHRSKVYTPEILRRLEKYLFGD